MNTEESQGAAAISRRDMLRRSAVVGGALAVAAPAVQSFARPAFASTDLGNLSSVYVVYRCGGTTFGLKWEDPGPWKPNSGTDGLFNPNSGQCDAADLSLYPPTSGGDIGLIDGPSGDSQPWTVTFDRGALGSDCGEDKDDDFKIEGVAKYSTSCTTEALNFGFLAPLSVFAAQSLGNEDEVQNLDDEDDEGDEPDSAFVTLPNVVGSPEQGALDDLEGLCEPKPCVRVFVSEAEAGPNDDGRVISQDPPARSEVERGERIDLVVGRAPEARSEESSTGGSRSEEGSSGSDGAAQTQEQDDPQPEASEGESEE